jgi:hypothetical protein
VAGGEGYLACPYVDGRRAGVQPAGDVALLIPVVGEEE